MKHQKVSHWMSRMGVLKVFQMGRWREVQVQHQKETWMERYQHKGSLRTVSSAITELQKRQETPWRSLPRSVLRAPSQSKGQVVLMEHSTCSSLFLSGNLKVQFHRRLEGHRGLGPALRGRRVLRRNGRNVGSEGGRYDGRADLGQDRPVSFRRVFHTTVRGPVKV